MTRGKPKDGSKNPGGRPKEWTEKALIKLGEDLINWLSKGPENVFQKDFLLPKGLYEDLISDHIKDYKSFADLIKKANEIEKHKFCKNALNNAYNTAMAIFVAKNNFGMVDKVESYNTHDGNIIITKSLLD